jgi:copper resistance protein B
MKKWGMLLLLTLLPASGMAAEKPLHDMKGHGFPADYQEAETSPKVGEGIQKYADDSQSDAQEDFGLQPIHDNEIFAVFSGDRLEYQSREGEEALLWDVLGWVGTDYDKLYLESEGAWLINEEEFEEVEVELLYGRNIATFWDLQAGIRHDFEPEPTRTFAALGIQGLAPQWFEVDATAYLSDDGDVSAVMEVEYDLLLSQRLILQPRFETGIALHEVEEYGIGQGFNGVELGLRLRYEIRRKFAPYIGISWNRKLGETADLAEAEGEDTDAVSFVTGIKFWF